MLCPGMPITAERVLVTVGAAPTPSFWQSGIGFSAGGRILLDSDAPAGSLFHAGLRINANGALYGTTTTAVDDVYIGGLRVSALGQVVYVDGAPTKYNSGNPQGASDQLAVNTV